MKIIQICAAYKPAYIYGGPTMSVSKLAEELVKENGAAVTVLTTTANGKTELNVKPGQCQNVDGVPVYYFKRVTKDHTHFSPALLSFLNKVIKAEKKAGTQNNLIIHIHAWWNLVSIFAALIAKWHGIKLLVSPRGMLTTYSLNNRNSRFKDLLHQFIGKQLLKYSHIHVTSDKEQSDVATQAEVKSYINIPNFVRFPAVITPLKREHSTYQLCFLSRIEEKKGLEILFKALAQINLNFHLTIAGTGNQTYINGLQQLAQSLSIAAKITWLGHVSNNDKFTLLANQDLLVLTSYNENFANVIIESLAMGTPVLVTEGVGLASYVTKNNFGWVCKNTPEAVANTLTTALNANETRTQIRHAAPQQIAQDFNETKLRKQYLAMYSQLKP